MEICDGIDNDCDGEVDEGAQNTYYRDADGDGYGDASVSIQACPAPAGYVRNNTDSDDTDKNVHIDSIANVSPSSATQGDTNVQVAITFNVNPTGLYTFGNPVSVKIGTMQGTFKSFGYAVQGTVLTAVFDIPANEPPGKKNVTVEFSAPASSSMGGFQTDGSQPGGIQVGGFQVGGFQPVGFQPPDGQNVIYSKARAFEILPKDTTGSQQPSVGSAPLLYLNEFMADNDGTIEDPDEPGSFEDWIEIYNAGDSAVDMAGMYMTDDLTNPTKWQIPAGVIIPAKGYLLFWADEDKRQGNTHTNFKLSKSGEAIGLFDTDARGNAAIDTLVFSEQITDASQGRMYDGGDPWVSFEKSTPGFPNSINRTGSGYNGDLNEDGTITPADALVAFRCYLGSATCPDGADVNKDGSVTPADALCVFRKYLGQTSCLD